MNSEVDKFSSTLNADHLNEAIAIKNLIQHNKDFNSNGLDAPIINVHSVDNFKKAFTFPQIALNDFATSQLDNMKEAEEQLNKDLALRNLVAVNVKTFVDTAKQTSVNLSKRYGRQWTNPNTE